MKFSIETNYRVAVGSYDHLYPFGTLRDNNTNRRLVQKLKEKEVTTLLDIGCAGGLFIEDCLKSGIDAVGLEGSDINERTKRASWGSIPDNLFTADATRFFSILNEQNELVRFDAITAWEFFEHIEEHLLDYVMQNIYNHSKKGTQLLCSITNEPSPHMGVDLHRTKKELDFWLSLFLRFEFEFDETLHEFYKDDHVRQGTFNLTLVRR